MDFRNLTPNQLYGRAIRSRPGQFVLRYKAIFAYCLLALVVAFTIGRVQAQADKTDKVASLAKTLATHNQREALARADQICTITERQQRAKVDQLVQTYDYLKQLTPAQAANKDTINPYIIANLPKTEAEARVDEAPLFCDKPGTGLSEPDPVIPQRPKFSYPVPG